MDLRNWELFTGSGAAVSGANVYVYEASLAHPNPGAALGTTTTDANGMWTFTGLSDTAKDVKVEYSDRVKWYKGLTLHSVYSVREFGEADPGNQTFLQNGGFEVNTKGVTFWSPVTSYGDILDGWQAKRGVGDTLFLSRAGIVAPNSQFSLEAIYTKSAGDGLVVVALPAALSYFLRGKTVSVSAQVRQAAGSAVRAYLYDGTTTTKATVSATTGSWITSAVENVAIGAAATSVLVGVSLEVSGTHYIDNVMLNLGSAAETFVIQPLDGAAFTITEAAPAADTAALPVLLNNLAERVKSIIGAAGNDWKDAVPATLTSLLAAVNLRETIANVTAGLALKVAKAGDTMTGHLKLNNSVALQTGRAADNFMRTVLAQTAADNLEVGNANLPLRLLGTGEATYNGSQVVTLANDGAGSTLDADLLDGQQGSVYLARANHTGTQTPATISPQGAGSGFDADTVDGSHAATLVARASHTGTQAPGTISPQGAGSGLDADTVDAIQAASFARVDAVSLFSAQPRIANALFLGLLESGGAIRSVLGMSSGNVVTFGNANNPLALIGGGAFTFNGNPVWTAGTDGSGTGMDADLLDGQQGSYYRARANHTGSQLASTISDFAAAVALLDAASIGSGWTQALLRARANHTGTQLAATISDVATEILARSKHTGTQLASTISDLAATVALLDAATVGTRSAAYLLARGNHTGTQVASTISPQGAGSLLDADMVDGLNSGSFVRSDAAQVFSAGSRNWSFTGGVGGIVVQGDFQVTGLKSRLATGRDGNQGLFHAVESPLPHFEEYGRTALVGSDVWVEIPEDFRNYVDTSLPYYVQVTPEGPAVLYVAEMAPDGFLVKLHEGRCNVPFSYRIAARQGDLTHIERGLPSGEAA